MDMHGDKHGYLRKSGAIPQQRCAVATKAIAVKGSTRGLGALGSAPNSTATPSKAKLKGNESARYEKLEKRSLKSLKQGGSEKELRAGHNVSMKDMASGGLSSLLGGGGGPSAAEMARRKRTQNVKKVAKSGIAVDAEKNPLLAARVDRKRQVTAAKAAGASVKDARKAGNQEVQAAKKTRASFTGAQKKAAGTTYKADVKAAKQLNRADRKESGHSRTLARWQR